MYLFPTGKPGQQALKGVVYADSNGAPGALLDTTKEFIFHSTQAAGFYELPFPNELQLSAGHYWLAWSAVRSPKSPGTHSTAWRASALSTRTRMPPVRAIRSGQSPPTTLR